MSQKFYSDSYSNRNTIRVNSQWTDLVRSRVSIPFSNQNKVLDIACGISRLGKIFSNNVYGFDINLQAIKVAKRNGIKATIGNVERQWKYPSESFDIVIASHIIEHVVNPDHILLEAKRVLKKNGFLIVATPNLAAWFNRILLLFGFQPFFTEISSIDKTLGMKFTRRFTPLRMPLGHLRVFTENALEDLLQFHGFSIVQVTGNEFLSFPPALLFIDRVFSRFNSLASNIIIVGRKE